MRKLFLWCALLVGTLLLLHPSAAEAIENDECMECHAERSLTRTASTGARQELYLDYRQFQYSVHNINGIGCVDCHADITQLDFDQEVPHSVSLAPVNCLTCHESEGQAYTQSVHKRASNKGMDIQCYACHGYHDVVSLAAKSVLERENNSCLKCHNPTQYHQWLPQKETHFSYVECTVCHAPDAPRHIHLRFFDLVKKEFLQPKAILSALGTDIDGFIPLLDTDGDAQLNVQEFENMVFVLRRRGVYVTFHGELLSEHQAVIHQVNKGDAKRVCEDCHASASPFFEAVTIFIENDDGTPYHFAVDRKVLESYSVSNFYVPGGTRIRELDLVGVVLVAGATLGIFSHLMGRILTIPIRRKRKELHEMKDPEA